MQNAEFALDYMRSQPRPSLIILDLMLPGMDGFEFIEALHDHASWRGIPIVVVTAKDLTQKEHDSLNRSVEMIMRKGIYNKDDLLNIVRTTMENTVVRKS
jgi:CheY-like chemotaxis protein